MTIYANKFFISYGSEIVRISFYDELDESKVRTSIAMSPADTVELAQVLLKLATQAGAKKP